MSLTAPRLKAWREGQGYTQKQVAEALGTSSRNYEKYEQGVYPIDRRLCLAIGMLAEFGLAADFDGEHILSGDRKP